MMRIMNGGGMKWLWLPGGILILMILVGAVGAMLPVRHHATRRARFRQSPQALYSICLLYTSRCV